MVENKREINIERETKRKRRENREKSKQRDFLKLHDFKHCVILPHGEKNQILANLTCKKSQNIEHRKRHQIF